MPLSAPVTAVAVERRPAGRLGRAAAAAMQGVRANFEDAHLLDQELGAAAVYDGHLGDEAAAFAAERLHLHVAAQLQGGLAEGEALTAAFAACDEELRGALPEGSEAGATATFALVREGPGGSLRVVVASAGDSRAVLWRKEGGAVEETRDHRPSDAGERRRIEAAGGFVADEFEPPRVDGQLACSRALGAFKFKQGADLVPGAQKVSSVPEVYEWQAQRGDWLILACDGVWDTFSSERVASEVCKEGAGHDLGDVLAKTLNLCIEKEADDNLTLMAVELGPAAPAEAEPPQVLPGNFIKTKDKEVSDEYVSFCLRFGFALKKEMKPKAPPAAALEPAEPSPGRRFGHLPLPSVAAKAAPAAPAAEAAPAPANAEGLVTMKVTAKRSAAFYAKAARELIAGATGDMEVQALGNALPQAAMVVAELVKDGHELVLVETGLEELVSTSWSRSVQTPKLRAVLHRKA